MTTFRFEFRDGAVYRSPLTGETMPVEEKIQRLVRNSSAQIEENRLQGEQRIIVLHCSPEAALVVATAIARLPGVTTTRLY